MSINLQTGGYQPPPSLPGARGADIQVGQKQLKQDAVLPVPVPSQGPATAPSAEENRYEKVLAAARAVAKDAYPISDMSFTIFKDTSGQYVTRYTSLRTGQVTYIPEPQALAAFEARQQVRTPVVSIQA